MPWMRWDVFCRVIDNLGDAGVCWRLAADLASRGEQVRVIIDDITPLQRMAPHGAIGVTVLPWHDDVALEPGTDVTIEAFGCDPPARYAAQMARADQPPCWINLEYLSAEPAAVRSHGLPSPQLAGPGRGLTKWFYFPGFADDSGGLVREPQVPTQRQAFARDGWLPTIGQQRRPTERVVVLFSYAHPGIAAWLRALAATPTLLLVPQGPAQSAVRQALGPTLTHAALRAELLDWLPQTQFDRLLWCADLSVVRGEDSVVRALWAGAPFVWQLYPQHDGAQQPKLQAFLSHWRAASAIAPPNGVDALMAWWNDAPDAGADVAAPPPLPAWAPWHQAVGAWREQLARQSDLTTRLIRFVAAKR